MDLHKIDDEQLLLGFIMTYPCVMPSIEGLKLPHFYDQRHQDIYGAILELDKTKKSNDLVDVRLKFLNNESLLNYLTEITFNLDRPLDAEHPQRIVNNLIELWKRRALKAILDEAQSQLGKDDAENVITVLEKKVDELNKGNQGKGYVSFKDACGKVLSIAIEARRRVGNNESVGISSGLRALDNVIGGFMPASLYTLAGSTGRGKTALVTNIAFNAVKNNYPIVFFSLEMPAEQLARRIIATESGISSERIQRGTLSQEEVWIIEQKIKELEHLCFHIEDKGTMDITSVRKKVIRYKQQHDVQMVVVDYLQLVSAESKKNENRTLEISNITRSLKGLAMDLNIPIIALSQLSRAADDARMPQLYHLRESGSIEHDSDVVMLVYQTEAGTPLQEDGIFIAKNRHGKMTTIPLVFDKQFTVFLNKE